MRRLVGPADAARELAAAVGERWPAWVLAARGQGEAQPVTVRLRVGVRSEIDYERLGFAAVQRWREAWDLVPGAGVTIERTPARAGGPADPLMLTVDDLSAAAGFVGVVAPDALADLPDGDAVHDLADRLESAGSALTPAALRGAWAQSAADQRILVEVVRWLSAHDDATGFTRAQLPVPELHTKWLTASRLRLVQQLTGRDLDAELRRRPPVVHFTYLDPEHRRSGRRRHDSWTGGDVHAPAYLPAAVVIVENRDCRLFFPPVERAIAVEGGGNAAEALLDQIPWIVGAGVVVYWGDQDADGFAILARLRETFATAGAKVESILMDAVTLHRFEHLRASTDRQGRPVRARGGVLRGLTEQEDEAYRQVATRGATTVRRVEQEKLPIELAAEAFRAVIRRRSSE